MFIDSNTSRADLEAVILSEAGLYEQFDERRLLNEGYSDDEYRQIIMAWIAAGDETHS